MAYTYTLAGVLRVPKNKGTAVRISETVQPIKVTVVFGVLRTEVAESERSLRDQGIKGPL